MPIKGVWCSVSGIFDAQICSATLPPADLSTCRGAWYSELQAITVSVMGAAAYAPFSPFFPSSPLRASNSELFTFVLRPCITLFVTKSAQAHRKS